MQTEASETVSPAATRIAQAVATGILLVLSLYGSEPYYNWDVVGYIGVANRFSGASPEAVHRRTYQAIEGSVPPTTYELLTTSNEYRRTNARDAQAFDQQLPFYQSKPVYPWLIHQLQRFGVDDVQATVWISRVAYIALGMVILVWLTPIIGRIWSVPITWAMMSLPPVLDLARLSTPDALSTFIILLSLWLACERQRYAAALGLLLLSTLVRPDNLLWLSTVTAWLALTKRLSIEAAAATFAGGLLVYGLVDSWSQNYGWTTLFYFAFVELLSYPATFSSPLEPMDYLRIYLRETHPSNLPSFVLLFALLGAFVFAARIRRYGRRDVWIELLATAAAFGVLHWLVLPDQDRYFVAVYMVTLIALAHTLWSKSRLADHSDRRRMEWSKTS